MRPFDSLSPEVLECITTYLTAEETRNLRSTCTRVRLALNESYWRRCVVHLPDENNEESVFDSRQFLYAKVQEYNIYVWPIVPWRVFHNPEKYSWFLNELVLVLELANCKSRFPNKAVLAKYPRFRSLCYTEYMHPSTELPIGTPEFFQFNDFYSSHYPNHPGAIKINDSYLSPTDICQSMSTTIKCLDVGFHRREDDDLIDALLALDFKNLEKLTIFSLDKRETAVDCLVKCMQSPKLQELSFTLHVIFAKTPRKFQLYIFDNVLNFLRKIPRGFKTCQLFVQGLEFQPGFLPHIQQEISDGLYCSLSEIEHEIFSQFTELIFVGNYSENWHKTGLDAFNSWGSFPNAFYNLTLDISILRDSYINPDAMFLQNINTLNLNHTLNERFLTKRITFPKFPNLSRVVYIRSSDEKFRTEIFNDPEVMKLCELLYNYLFHLCQINPEDYPTSQKILLELVKYHGLNDPIYEPFIIALFNFFVDVTQFNQLWESAESLTNNVYFSHFLKDLVTNEVTFKWLMEINSLRYLQYTVTEGLYPSPFFHNLTKNHSSLKQVQFICKTLPYKREISGLGWVSPSFNIHSNKKLTLTHEFERYLYRLMPNVSYKYISSFKFASMFMGFFESNDTTLFDVIFDLARKRNFRNTPYQHSYSPDAPLSKNTQLLKACQRLCFNDLPVDHPDFDGWI